MASAAIRGGVGGRGLGVTIGMKLTVDESREDRGTDRSRTIGAGGGARDIGIAWDMINSLLILCRSVIMGWSLLIKRDICFLRVEFRGPQSWREFFILATAQYLMPLNFSQLLYAYEIMNNNRENREPTATLMQEVDNFQKILHRITQLRIDENEYYFLRAIVLFKTNSDADSDSSSTTDDGGHTCRSLQEPERVRSLHEDSKAKLSAYVNTVYPIQVQRCKELLLILPDLGSVSNYTIEEIFFRQNIGYVSIAKLTANMYSQRKAHHFEYPPPLSNPVFLINPQMEDKAADYSSLVAALSQGAHWVVQSSNKEQQ
uniref:Uncharacterized protein n=1 Tax=Phlebotomus papatasi TaxID=29031 RepID=A0A1B0D470_PHLPP